jgi:hypothetical protein
MAFSCKRRDMMKLKANRKNVSKIIYLKNLSLRIFNLKLMVDSKLFFPDIYRHIFTGICWLWPS